MSDHFPTLRSKGLMMKFTFLSVNLKMAPCRCDIWFPNYIQSDLAFIQQNKSDAVSHENKQHDSDQIFSNIKTIHFDIKCYAIIHASRW